MRSSLLAASLLAVPCSLAAQLDSSFSAIQGGPYQLVTATYRAQPGSSPSVLIVVLHGDAPFNKPDYQYRFAAAVARAYPTTVAVAILRPGYTDPAGRTSQGIRGETTGDNYNAANTDALAAAIVALRHRFTPGQVILVGHSGGAALSANLLARHPDLAAAALLVSCPCDVEAWRRHMLARTGFAGFQGPVETLSPIDLVDQLPGELRIMMVVGEGDNVTPPELTQAYAAKARNHGASVVVEVLPGEGHEILLKPEILMYLNTLLQ